MVIGHITATLQVCPCQATNSSECGFPTRSEKYWLQLCQKPALLKCVVIEER